MGPKMLPLSRLRSYGTKKVRARSYADKGGEQEKKKTASDILDPDIDTVICKKM